MKQAPLTVVLMLLCIVLAGCSGPAREDVADRILIEYEGLTAYDTSGGEFDDLADSVAIDLENGNCGQPAYFVGLADNSELHDATLIACTFYYEDQMPARLRDEATAIVLREATEGE